MFSCFSPLFEHAPDALVIDDDDDVDHDDGGGDNDRLLGIGSSHCCGRRRPR